MSLPPSEEPSMISVSLEAQIDGMRAELHRLVRAYPSGMVEEEAQQQILTLRAVIQTLEAVREIERQAAQKPR